MISRTSSPKVDKQVVKVQAREVAMAEVKYKNMNINPASWNLQDKKFLDTTQPFDGKLLVLAEHFIERGSHAKNIA
jgi:hypothetical protein